MTREGIIGTWRSVRKIENGKDKKIKRSKFTITFADDGTGKMKILLFSVPFRWSFRDNMLSMSNATDGTPLESQITFEEGCMVMREKDSATYFAKD